MKMNVYFISNQTSIEDDDIKLCNLDYCYNYLKDQPVISIDIETTQKYGGKFKGEGLVPQITKIVMLQIGTKEKQFVIDYRNIDISILKPILTDKEIVKVGHNLKFEYVHIFENEGIRLNNLYDTMIAEKILFNGFNLPTSLKDLNERYLDIQVDKSTRLEFLTIKDTPFSSKQIFYGAEDILYPLLIRDKQIIDGKKKRVLNCFKLEFKFIEVLGDIEHKGLYFDKEIWEDTYNKNFIKYTEAHSELDKFVIDNFPNSKFIEKQLNLFDSETKCNIKWTSSKQVINLFVTLGVCPIEKSKTTGKMSYTVEAKVLKSSLNTINSKISQSYKDLITLYLKFKKIEQSCTTFGIDYFKYINPITNRLHSNYNQIVNTGRMSSRNPNLQNVPSTHDFRSAFSCPDGWKIINADYSGQETVILANKSEEPNIIKLILEGGDMHAFVTKAIHPELSELSDKEIKTLHPDKRQVAKAAGFAVQYGGNGYTISNNLGIPSDEGDFVYNSYFKAFPKLKEFFNILQLNAKHRGYILIDAISGRKYWFKKPKTSSDFSKINRLALNYTIQGEAGGITKYAAILFRKWILDNNLQTDVFITNIVHDEINVEAKEQIAERTAKALENAMETAGSKWCKIVPLKADAVITTYWNH